jgi:hypothetical protein
VPGGGAGKEEGSAAGPPPPNSAPRPEVSGSPPLAWGANGGEGGRSEGGKARRKRRREGAGGGAGAQSSGPGGGMAAAVPSPPAGHQDAFKSNAAMHALMRLMAVAVMGMEWAATSVGGSAYAGSRVVMETVVETVKRHNFKGMRDNIDDFFAANMDERDRVVRNVRDALASSDKAAPAPPSKRESLAWRQVGVAVLLLFE